MISILMPIYNGIEFIHESVESIKNQTYAHWELIIGINGHPKNSEVFLKAKQYESDDIKVLDMVDVKGKSNALNNMIDYCKYDWISLIDVDDIWEKTKLQSQIEYMSEYDVIGTCCKYFGKLSGIVPIPTKDVSSYNFLIGNPIINSSSLIKKDLCSWDPEYDGVEDYNLWLQLWKNKNKFYNVDSVEVYHRIHEDSCYNSNGNDNMVKLLIDKYK